jgi:hypothetical protein
MAANEALQAKKDAEDLIRLEAEQAADRAQEAAMMAEVQDRLDQQLAKFAADRAAAEKARLAAKALTDAAAAEQAKADARQKQIDDANAAALAAQQGADAEQLRLEREAANAQTDIEKQAAKEAMKAAIAESQ